MLQANLLPFLRRFRSRLLLLSALAFVGLPSAVAITWFPFGPFGGDARSFGVDPTNHEHLYLGTSDGWVFESINGGKDWHRLARLANRDDLVLDHILVDPANPRHLLVGTWKLGSTEGGVFSSQDAGKTWTENPDLKGESIRSMTSTTGSFQVLAAGTLRGVFQSTDGGSHWKLISPPDSKEIHEVESVAIDPKDPKILYAGTWHLPWKTTDDGANWTNIKDGIIDDSDVFSIIVDPKSPNIVYASACSGIYRSDDAGGRFVKVQGIPSTARRTRVLKQDPEQLSTVFAGTTEGLFRTTDGGKTWSRTTGPEVIVNDVFVDPTNSQRVLLATDRGGVLASNDGGSSFAPSNTGFTARQVVAYAADARQPALLYAGVINDKEWGGAFFSNDGGLSWTQQSTGLGGRDVFALAQAADGTFIAGTSHGIFRLKDSLWQQVDDVREGSAPVSHAAARPNHATARNSSPRRGTPTTHRPTPQKKGEAFDGGAFALAADGNLLFAVTTRGLLTSDSSGVTFSTIPGVPPGDYRTIAVAKTTVVAATLTSRARSADGGTTWADLPKPSGLTQIAALAVDDEGDVWAGGREGLFVLRGGQGSWQNPPNLPIRDINSLFFDRRSKQILATANNTTTLVFTLQLPAFTNKAWDTGWHMRWIRQVGDHLIGAALFDGIVVQPRMVESPFAAAPK